MHIIQEKAKKDCDTFSPCLNLMLLWKSTDFRSSTLTQDRGMLMPWCLSKTFELANWLFLLLSEWLGFTGWFGVSTGPTKITAVILLITPDWQQCPFQCSLSLITVLILIWVQRLHHTFPWPAWLLHHSFHWHAWLLHHTFP